jgi:transcriptional regulator with XRE-family HTH domain
MSPVNVPSIGAYIREQREQAKISLRQLAQAAGVSNPYLSQIERGLRRPSADILQQIARGLRISAEALYVQAGFLEDRPAGTGVRDAVLSDQELNERQKQMLLEIYESFRKETEAARTVLVGETVADDDAAGDSDWIGEESPDELWPAVEPWPGDEDVSGEEPAPDPEPGGPKGPGTRDRGSVTEPRQNRVA